MQGYYQRPTLGKSDIVFVCEDDLWCVNRDGGIAFRLTAQPGRSSDPVFSPQGSLCFSGRDEGHSEVYRINYESGECERLTYLGGETRALIFSPQGDRIFYTTNSGQAFAKSYVLGSVAYAGGPARSEPWGPASTLAFQPAGPGRVLGRHTWDSARWKRYRGGTAGQLWIDREGRGEFVRLVETGGNLTCPLWLGERIYFISDHEGIGNLYSCDLEGHDLQAHTHHRDFYVRHAKSDGKAIVYQCGAEIFLWEQGDSRKVEIRLRGSRAQRLRKFATTANHLESYALHPQGHSLAVVARGRGATFPLWEQSVRRLEVEGPHRMRLLSYLPDGERLAAMCDRSGEERLEIWSRDGFRSCPEELGRAIELLPSPCGERIALTNHRHQLLIIDLATPEAAPLLVEENPHGRLADLAWSKDGAWLAYASPVSRLTRQICLWEAATQQSSCVTEGQFYDSSPAFDPEGRYLFFLSARTFDPVRDSFHFELAFIKGSKPYLILLREDVANPLILDPRAPGDDKPKKKKKSEPPLEDGDAPREETPPLAIDLHEISGRILELPVPEGRYGQLAALSDQVLWTLFPVEGSLDARSDAPLANASLQSFEWKTLEKKELFTKVSDFQVSLEGNALAYRSGYRLRVVHPSKKPESSEDTPGRKSGWIQLTRMRIPVLPAQEWNQMAREAWRLMRDHFWDEAMSQIDWEAVFQRYQPLLERLGSRSELADWLWELQAELGTSHAYEYGGDYSSAPNYAQGKLAIDLDWDEQAQGYRVVGVVDGDCWNADATSPLRRPGARIRPGDVIVAIQGTRLSPQRPWQEALLHSAGQEVEVVLQDDRIFHVKTLRYETPARYRQWVENNRARVRELSHGRLGYLHIPNMGPLGYAEFHRGYFAEVNREGLIVDVRYNGGGNVSQLLLEKLARRIIGWDVSRYGHPTPYPMDAPRGPVVALTNEEAGSDGDIFSHAFKLLGIGPLVGTRTWGGVVGIWPRHKLVDGGTTTQPEFSFWFEDVGWRMENYGTDPDHPVEISPQDYRDKRDPQLDKAIQLALEALEKRSQLDFGPRPDRRA